MASTSLHNPTLRPAVLELIGRRARTETDDPSLDEAFFLAELRRIVEGARTPAEDRLARRHRNWPERVERLYARYAD